MVGVLKGDARSGDLGSPLGLYIKSRIRLNVI